MEVKWFTSLRQYLHHIGGSIELEDPGTPPKQRVNDAYIMDMVLASSKFKPAQIWQIDYCRMYLQAVTISDITRANGMQLDMPMRRGQPSPQSSTSRWHRFNQIRPPQTAWTLWKKACLLWSDTQLSLQLGMWLYPANELRRQWHAYYVPKDRLYIFQNNRYDHHLPLELEFDLDVHDSDLVLPLDALPVSAEATADFWEIIGPACRMLVPAAPIVPSSFQEFLTSLEPWEASLFHTIELRHPSSSRNREIPYRGNVSRSGRRSGELQVRRLWMGAKSVKWSPPCPMRRPDLRRRSFLIQS